MAKIKICFGITKATGGGAQKYVYDLATTLPTEEFLVSLVTGLPGTLSENLQAQQISVTVIPSLGRDVNILKDLVSLWQLWRYFRRERPNVLHLNSPKMGFTGALAARLAGVKKIIYTSHGWPFLEPRSYLSRLFFKHLCWYTIRLSSQTIVISKAERDAVAHWPLIGNRLKLVYNGLAATDQLTRETARQQLGLRADALVIGTIAELHPNKALDCLVTAAASLIAKHPHLHLAIIGEGEERRELTLLIRQYQLTDQIHLLGEKAGAARLLPAFDIFILPSVKEGLPYVILEAGLASLPVIATRVGGIPEIIEPEQNGLLIEPRDPQAITEAIETLIQHPSKRQKFGNNLHAKVQKDFSLEQMVRETVALYR